jgi:hypothetical protein
MLAAEDVVLAPLPLPDPLEELPPDPPELDAEEFRDVELAGLVVAGLVTVVVWVVVGRVVVGRVVVLGDVVVLGGVERAGLVVVLEEVLVVVSLTNSTVPAPGVSRLVLVEVDEVLFSSAVS